MKLIALTNNKFAKVSDTDFKFLRSWNWFATYNKTGHTWYAVRNGPKGLIYMHREILQGAEYVDHIDRDGLNNQRRNLRRSNSVLNQGNTKIRRDNTTGYKGVCFRPKQRKYQAYIRKLGVFVNLGSFEEATDAARAYNAAAKQHFGQHARLNLGV